MKGVTLHCFYLYIGSVFQDEISWQSVDASLGRASIALEEHLSYDDVMFGVAIASKDGRAWSGIEWIRCVYDETKRLFDSVQLRCQVVKGLTESHCVFLQLLQDPKFSTFVKHRVTSRSNCTRRAPTQSTPANRRDCRCACVGSRRCATTSAEASILMSFAKVCK